VSFAYHLSLLPKPAEAGLNFTFSRGLRLPKATLHGWSSDVLVFFIDASLFYGDQHL